MCLSNMEFIQMVVNTGTSGGYTARPAWALAHASWPKKNVYLGRRAFLGQKK